jgi:hypothetical protein
VRPSVKKNEEKTTEVVIFNDFSAFQKKRKKKKIKVITAKRMRERERVRIVTFPRFSFSFHFILFFFFPFFFFVGGFDMVDTWLILPVVICLSQRLSHACLSINGNINTVKLRMAH